MLALRFVHWGIRKFPLNDPLDECPFHVVVVTIDGSLLKSIVSGSREVFFRALEAWGVQACSDGSP